jgi:hypothetical protein
MLPNIDMIYADCTIEAFASGNGRFGSLLGMPNRKYWQRSMLHGYCLGNYEYQYQQGTHLSRQNRLLGRSHGVRHFWGGILGSMDPNLA